MPRIGITMGSDSDIPKMKGAASIPDAREAECEVSAHRAPDGTVQWNRGLPVIIAGAGTRVALPGAAAAHTDLPAVTALKAWAFDGLKCLLSTAQMPPGVPVATLAVNGARKGVLHGVRRKRAEYTRQQSALVDEKDRDFQKKGFGGDS